MNGFAKRLVPYHIPISNLDAIIVPQHSLHIIASAWHIIFWAKKKCSSVSSYASFGGFLFLIASKVDQVQTQFWHFLGIVAAVDSSCRFETWPAEVARLILLHGVNHYASLCQTSSVVARNMSMIGFVLFDLSIKI